MERWYEEGLPKKKGLPDNAVGHNIRSNFNINFQNDETIDQDVHDYFGFDFSSFSIKNDFSPMFKKTTIEEDERFIIFKDEYGITQKRLKDEKGGIRSSMPMYLDYPIKSRKDFDSYKENYDLDFSKRVDENWIEATKKKHDNGDLIWLCGRSNGFFWFPRKLMGLENFMMSIYDDPKLINEMLDFILDYTLSFWTNILDNVKVDLVLINEDMAYKGGPLLSLNSFKELLMPRYKKLTSFLKDCNIKHIFIDSDGDMTSLIPLILECGANGLLPAEITGSMDVVKIAKDFPELRIAGGINKMKLFNGKDDIDKELEKVPTLLKRGGYIPFIDHSIPPLISWDNFIYYREKLNSMIDSTIKE